MKYPKNRLKLDALISEAVSDAFVNDERTMFLTTGEFIVKLKRNIKKLIHNNYRRRSR